MSAHPARAPGGMGDTNGTAAAASLDDFPQNDEPPRVGVVDHSYPVHWNKQSQNRTLHLISANSQFLVVYNNTIYGTLEPRPHSSILRFFSHEMYVVISSYDSHQYLCLNRHGTLYLRKDISPDCYLNESNQSAFLTYEFIHYKNLPKRYLSVDCDAETSNDTTASSVRFNNLEVDKAKLSAATPSGPPTCISQAQKLKEAKRRALKTRRMLKARWCWNLNRIQKKNETYIQNCTKKYCSKERERGSKCVCNILENMLKNVKRAKRKCLIAKVRSWVQNKNLIPNDTVVREVAKRLLPVYQGISKRMQNLAKQKRRQSGQTASEKPGSRKQGTKATNRPIKINRLLDKFRDELANVSSTKNIVHQPKEHGVSSKNVVTLSKAFAEKLDSLVRPHRRRLHKSRRTHKKRRHRARRSRKLNSFSFKKNLTNSHKSSSSSPG